jgi:hypothetical protein
MQRTAIPDYPDNVGLFEIVTRHTDPRSIAGSGIGRVIPFFLRFRELELDSLIQLSTGSHSEISEVCE